MMNCDFRMDVCRWRINTRNFDWDVVDIGDSATGMYSYVCILCMFQYA